MGHETQSTRAYNIFGQTLTAINAEGVQLFSNSYDDAGRIITQDDSMSDNQLFRLDYDEDSQPGHIITTVTNRNGNRRVYTYDTDYQLLSLENELGQTRHYAYANG